MMPQGLRVSFKVQEHQVHRDPTGSYTRQRVSVFSSRCCRTACLKGRTGIRCMLEQIGVSPAEDESQAIRVCLPYGECNGGETGRV